MPLTISRVVTGPLHHAGRHACADDIRPDEISRCACAVVSVGMFRARRSDQTAAWSLRGAPDRRDADPLDAVDVRSRPRLPIAYLDATSVLTVGLDRHRRKRRLDMGSLQKNRLEAGLRQSGVKPLRQRPGFEPDPNHRKAQLLEEGDERIGIARNFRLPHRSRHNVPWLSSVPDAWGRCATRTPFRHHTGAITASTSFRTPKFSWRFYGRRHNLIL